ncbi:MAG: hypothetical protein AB8B96_05775 [Lysobacterales bacterium]
MSESTPFEVLSELIRPYASKMVVKHDTEANLYLEETTSSDKPQMFAAVQAKKRYTSFHLFPVYLDPSLLDRISESLKKRMQGKSCFNFTTVDQVPVAELKALVNASFKNLHC